MAATAVAEFDNVTKDYPAGFLGRRKVRAVAGVSLRVEPGEVFGLLGPNRAGKTTLVKLLLSLCRPTSGRAFRLGRPVCDRSTLGRVGYMHESPAFPRYLSAAGLLEYYGALALMPEPDARRRAAELLGRLGLADRAREPIARFSKGMVQRLALAQALLNDPELLVLDEPTEGLDLPGRQLVHAVVAEQRRRGRGVLLVSHSLPDVEALCDRVGVVVGGRLAYAGPLAGLAGGRGERPLAEVLRELYAVAPLPAFPSPVPPADKVLS
ncbi:MAG TPA: ABC transporter ATP-binding protein [Gemmataceae bacterium]|nr:ABC transporter ATP-binding protein [Gemmataceae bacterium]